MGPLGRFWQYVGLVLLGCWTVEGRAHAVDVLVIFPEGAPLAGDEIPMDVLIHEQGKPVMDWAPEIMVSAGTLVAKGGREREGVWSFRYQAPSRPQAVPIEIRVNGSSYPSSIPVSAELSPLIDSGPIQTGRAGQERALTFQIGHTEPGAKSHLVVGTPEGVVRAVRASEMGVEVDWMPGGDPFPRAIPLGFRDKRQPGTPPAWTVAYLKSYPTLPIRTEAETRVLVKVGGRSYGPIRADANGLAEVKVEVRPGEEVAEVVLTDRLGNVQETAIRLGGDPRPSLVALAEGIGALGERRSVVHVFAIRPDGKAWRGKAPACKTSLGQDLTGVSSGAGAWRFFLPRAPEGAFFDIRVDCALGGQAQTSIRVPVEGSLASVLRLRAYPSELLADMPVTQVEAFLENQAGERLPAESIQLNAQIGHVERLDDESGSASVRGIYNGEAAVAAGEDVLRATWELPQGEGGVWFLVPAGECQEGKDHCLVRARVMDRLGRPLPGIEVNFEAHGEAVVMRSDSRGWASTSLSRGEVDTVFVATMRAGTVEREFALFLGEQQGPLAQDADLSAEIKIQIRAGSVRNVFLNVEPNPMMAGRDVNARIRLKLVDKDGNTVEDDSKEVHATEGVLTRPRLRGGEYESTWAPRPGMARGTVQITATSGTGLFVDTATELEVIPRPIHWAASLEGGWLWGADSISSPWLGLSLDRKLEVAERSLYARFELGHYRIITEGQDTQTGSNVRMEWSLMPVGVGVLARQERGRLGTWIGGSMKMVPYRMGLSFGDESAIPGGRYIAPGGCLFMGAGLRFLSTELYSQVTYELVSLTGDEVGVSGPGGGASIRAGYRFLF